jgi:hypothetical protein
MAERTLSQRELNRALLARQLLLERVRLPIPRALERLGGIQNQYAPNAYIRLWSCVEGFRRDDLTRALERGSVVQASLMRATIHVVSRRDYWPSAVAIRAAQRDWWLRTRTPRPKERDLERQADQLRAMDSARRGRAIEVVGRRGMVGPARAARVPRRARGAAGSPLPHGGLQAGTSTPTCTLPATSAATSPRGPAAHAGRRAARGPGARARPPHAQALPRRGRR